MSRCLWCGEAVPNVEDYCSARCEALLNGQPWPPKNPAKPPAPEVIEVRVLKLADGVSVDARELKTLSIFMTCRHCQLQFLGKLHISNDCGCEDRKGRAEYDAKTRRARQVFFLGWLATLVVAGAVIAYMEVFAR